MSRWTFIHTSRRQTAIVGEAAGSQTREKPDRRGTWFLFSSTVFWCQTWSFLSCTKLDYTSYRAIYWTNIQNLDMNNIQQICNKKTTHLSFLHQQHFLVTHWSHCSHFLTHKEDQHPHIFDHHQLASHYKILSHPSHHAQHHHQHHILETSLFQCPLCNLEKDIMKWYEKNIEFLFQFHHILQII